VGPTVSNEGSGRRVRTLEDLDVEVDLSCPECRETVRDYLRFMGDKQTPLSATVAMFVSCAAVTLSLVSTTMLYRNKVDDVEELVSRGRPAQDLSLLLGASRILTVVALVSAALIPFVATGEMFYRHWRPPERRTPARTLIREMHDTPVGGRCRRHTDHKRVVARTAPDGAGKHQAGRRGNPLAGIQEAMRRTIGRGRRER